MAQPVSIPIAARLARNLAYKLAYLQICQEFLRQGVGAEVAECLQALIEGQQASIAGLAGRLRHLGRPPTPAADEKLLAQAQARRDVRGRLEFIRAGLERSAAWYGQQLLDPEVATDPDTRRLLLELGQNEAGLVWRVGALLAELDKRSGKRRET